MIKVLYNIFNKCRHYILSGLPKKGIVKNKKGDITKFFDKYIENIIISNLKKKCKIKAKILSEELNKNIKINSNISGDYNYIIIDPVDGSDNYMVDIPFVCMGISFFDNKKKPIYSFVGNYYSNEWIYADKNRILFNKSSHEIKRKNLLIFTFSKFKKIGDIQDLIDNFDIIRSLGATIGEMIMVTQKKAEAFIDIRGELTLENFAPFFLIAKYFNLKLVDEKGQEIKLYNLSMTKKYKIIYTKNHLLKKIIKNFN